MRGIGTTLLLCASATLLACARDGRAVRPLVVVPVPPDVDAERGAGVPPPAPPPLVGGDALPLFRDLLGKEPPEFAPGGRWIRAPQALRLSSLRGRVVLLHFAFLACPACAGVVEKVARWRREYAAQGLSVLYVDNGRRDSYDLARAAALDGRLPFAIRHDANEATTIAYAVRAYPTTYVVGRDGRVAWQGVTVGAEAEVEAAIRAALAAR
jgi:hypothetical protein